MSIRLTTRISGETSRIKDFVLRVVLRNPRVSWREVARSQHLFDVAHGVANTPGVQRIGNTGQGS
jgi:hypothetical protein